MINRTKEYIDNGLDDVRSSVQLLHENVLDQPFIPELIKLIDETMRQTQVEITCEIDAALPKLQPIVEITIYRALQEGLTNGIRHGCSTHFEFSLTYREGQIRFILSNNGKVPSQFVHGFGLKAMNERVKEIGGELTILNERAADGVALDISIPIQRKTIERREQIV